MKGKGLFSVASKAWQGALRPYLVGVTELSTCLIKGPQSDEKNELILGIHTGEGG